MVLNRIHHKHPLYKGCTLEEMIGVALVCGALTLMVSVLFSHWCFDFAVIGVLVGLPLSYLTTWLALHAISAFKQHTPTGYTKQWCHYHLQRLGILRLPRVIRSGHWSIAP